jgi:putative restriction endonuclease
MADLNTESLIRAASFQWIKSQYEVHGGSIPRDVLEAGFFYQEQRITVIGPAGIWKPKQFNSIPLSITTVYGGPYDDSFTDDGLLIYRYRGTDPNHRDNAGLREAMQTRTPLIYLHGIVHGRYLPVWPVFIIDDNPQSLSFLVAIDPAYAFGPNTISIAETYTHQPPESALGIRKYVASYTLKRLHQTSFRENVISAYSSNCTFCRLKHRELLDAAHIIPDADPLGDPIVPNGLCLCKIHHAAFDENIVGIDPEYTIHIRRDVLAETDGPMLLHGLQELDQKQIIVPHRKQDRPDPNRLLIRFNEFKKVG